MPTSSWKYNIIEEFFDKDIVMQIRSIPLSSVDPHDEVIWRHEGSGVYTRKSGNRLLINEQGSAPTNFSSTLLRFYSLLWDTNLPEMILINMWRICLGRNGRPIFSVRFRLKTEWCYWCHIRRFGTRETVWFMTVSLHLFLKLSPWLSLKSGILLALYHVLQLSRTATSGVVNRNSSGLIMAAWSDSYSHVADACIAEDLACKQAVLFARDLGFSSVINEGDSLTVIKKLNASSFDRSIISPIVYDIKDVARSFDSISFRFVRRDANNDAHVLAHECQSQQCPLYWIEEVPQYTTAAA
ncbi:hypothetical protein V6N12_018137 [Hibiscus sabdariffa]|uniref:RNase H type-1 domain-containing protein n=1 Tax=Hibiscus sabdariffa TaxID=183260 RepID=A0ABR2AFY2_9ROSI